MSLLEFSARDATEPHRAATPLELMFDLASVIAIATAAVGLHHGIAGNHTVQALTGFLFAFFMIWWSWMNYTWFASAYDDGSSGFRVLSMIAMFGALTIAAGIPAVFSNEPIYLCLLGFVIMRVTMAVFWFAAARGDADHRKTALRYGVGIVVLQVYWILVVLGVSPAAPIYPILIGLGIVGELAVPAIAELGAGPTTWHRHHIIERFGLLNIIVLGECFLAVVIMLRLDEHGMPAEPHGILTAAACAAVTFSLWSIYFTKEEHLEDDEMRRALLWGYGHFAIFAAGAATGAGFAVFHEVATGYSDVGMQTAGYAIAIPIAIYFLALYVVRDRYHLSGLPALVLPTVAAVVLVLPLLFPEAPVPIALTLVAAAAWRSRRQAPRRQSGIA